MSHDPNLAGQSALIRDDRILGYTRGLSWFIAPFLLVAWVILYLFPGQTQRLFAWTIHPKMTPMVLASAYLGGFYYFTRLSRQQRWTSVKIGFPSVTLFASLLGIATIAHWNRFNHAHPAFWVWTALYLGAPFLVATAWAANNRYSLPADPADARLGTGVRWMIGLTGAAALATGIVMFLVPARVIPIWPWLLTPLTCRVIGAVFCLGSALLVLATDPRWLKVHLILRVEMIMIGLILVAAVRAHAEFLLGRPLTWVMLAGFLGVFAGSIWLWRAEPHVTDLRESTRLDAAQPLR